MPYVTMYDMKVLYIISQRASNLEGCVINTILLMAYIHTQILI